MPSGDDSGHVIFLSLADAKRLNWDSMIAWIDDSNDYGEERWAGIAPLGCASLHTVFAEIDEETARVISLRRSTNQRAICPIQGPERKAATEYPVE
jgi:uncharacterized DUF497 family protein